MGQAEPRKLSGLIFLPAHISAFPAGATQRAHGRILSERAGIVQVMVTTFFKTRNPRKH
jgi:hypothetical protein